MLLEIDGGDKLVPGESWEVAFEHEGEWVYLDLVIEAPNGKVAGVISEPVRVAAVPK